MELELDPELDALEGLTAVADETELVLEAGGVGVLTGDAFEVIELEVVELEALGLAALGLEGLELEVTCVLGTLLVVVGNPPTRLVDARLKAHHSLKMPAALVASAEFEQLCNPHE